LVGGLAVLWNGMRYMRLKVGESKEEAGRGTCTSRAKLQLAAATCDYRQERPIPLIHENITPQPHIFSHTHTHTMQSTRAFNMLRQRAAPVFRAQQPVRGLRLQSSPKMRSPANVRTATKQANIEIPTLTPIAEGGALRFVPAALKERKQHPNSTTNTSKPHAAHTISQRIRSLKKIPVELLPIGLVLAVALGAAGYSILRKFWTDKTLRLSRSGPQAH
jgi:hypothetical protein